MAIYFDDIQGDVASIFVSYFKRAPEFEAMQWYVTVLEGLQADPATADNAFNLLSAHIYADGVAAGEVPAGPTISNAWYVDYLYQSILGRPADAEGREFWITSLNNGSIERAELVSTFIASALASEGRDAAYVENRTFVAVEFAQWNNSNAQVLPTLKYNAAEVLLGVTEDPVTVEAAQGRLESATGQIGRTWTLTTGIDLVEGTSGNDTINAVFDSGPNDQGATFTPFDSIDGGLGFDTFNIYVDAADVNGVFPANAVVRNIEVVNVYNGAAAQASLTNVKNYGGVEQFWQIDTARDVTNVGEGVAVGFRAVKEGDLTVALAAAVTDANLVLDKVGSLDEDKEPVDLALTVKGDALTTVNVAGTLANDDNTLELDVVAGKGIKALTISTAVDTELQVWSQLKQDQTPATLIQTLDLSGSTGSIEFYIGAEQATHLVGSNAALNVTFGAGDDVIVFHEQTVGNATVGRGLTLRDNLDGGEGYNTVVLFNDGKIQTQLYNAIERLENFQQLAFAGNNVEVDAAELEGYELAFGGDGDVTVSNLADGANITIGSVGASLGLADDDEPDTVTLNAAGKDISVTLANDVTFQLVVATKDDAAIGAKGGKLALSGEGAVLFSNAASSKFATIDASELEGFKMTQDDIDDFEDDVSFPEIDALVSGVSVGLVLAAVELNDAGDIVGVGSGMSGGVKETVTLNVDTLDLIAVGVAPKPVLDAPAPAVGNSSTYGKMDVIEGFNSDAKAGPLDYLFGGQATIAAEALDLGANVDTLQLAFQSAAQQAATAGADVVYFVFEGDTYLFSDNADVDTSGQYDNDDFALKIVGEHGIADQWLSAA